MSPAGTAWVAAVTVFVLAVPHVSADQVVQSIDWQRLQAAGALAPGTVVAPADATGRPCLRVAHTGPAATIRLTTIERPAITQPRYALRGRVRLEGVARSSCLEM